MTRSIKILRKIALYNNVCCLRWQCKNINMDKCKPLSRRGKDYIECGYFG
ncbi:hypothetical protein LCGC14_0435170 [marine sediment metagenome]|uniref:Uncharacterized protein n=1 Tax=marine sediment metagenome TaxID=412755 RepID=A0A0F9SM51_9ZZZZ